MRIWKRMAVGVITFAVAVSAMAQSPYRDVRPQTTQDLLRQPMMDKSFGGILDPSRITMSHQMGMGYSSAGGGVTQGYYQNTISYRFDAPVLLRLRTGVTNNPFANSGTMSRPGQSALANMFNNAEFFGGADLLWKPKDNVHIKLSFDKMPPGMMGYGYGYYDMFGMSSRYRPTWYGADPFMMDPGFDQIGTGR